MERRLRRGQIAKSNCSNEYGIVLYDDGSNRGAYLILVESTVRFYTLWGNPIEAEDKKDKKVSKGLRTYYNSIRHLPKEELRYLCTRKQEA